MGFFDELVQRTYTPEWIIAARLLVAILLGAAIGFERESKNRPAGLRTHMLVALAAAVVAVVTLELGKMVEAKGVHSDPVRALEAVTAGVAFLAAGTIIQARGQVVGLTTGAGMWLAGAIGVAAGFGFLTIAVMAALCAMFILTALRRLANHINPKTDDGKAIHDKA
jgi:putative Mg2+ transporter-C (MgtC) family protein